MVVIHSTIEYLLDTFKDAPVIILRSNTDWEFYDRHSWNPNRTVKRILLLKDAEGNEFLAINPMGSYFSGNGNQRVFAYAHRYWDSIESVMEEVLR